MVSDESIKVVFLELQLRRRHPSGSYDNAGRWYADNSSLIDVRRPTRAWPYSQMVACRSLKYVTRVAYAFCCRNIQELRNRV